MAGSIVPKGPLQSKYLTISTPWSRPPQNFEGDILGRGNLSIDLERVLYAPSTN